MAFKTYAGGAGALALLAALAGAHPRTGDAAHALAALMDAAAHPPRADFDTDALTGLGIASLSVLADVPEPEARRPLGVDLAPPLDAACAALRGDGGVVDTIA